MFNQNKKGLSAIVATLIVILLAIVAFGIVSGVFQDLISDRAERAEAESSDLRLDIQRVDIEGNKSNVSLQRKGSDSVELVGAKFVFESESSNAVMERNFSLDAQERGVISMPLCSEEFSDVDLSSESSSVTVYPIVDFEGERVLIESQASDIDFVNVGDYTLTSDCSSGSDNSNPPSDSCADIDGDGWNDSASCNDGNVADCNDTNSSLNPETDWYLDSDGDGYYVNNKTQCQIPTPEPDWKLNLSGSIKGSDDCNDDNSQINPGSEENCEDNFDNDCDGDENYDDSDCQFDIGF